MEENDNIFKKLLFHRKPKPYSCRWYVLLLMKLATAVILILKITLQVSLFLYTAVLKIQHAVPVLSDTGRTATVEHVMLLYDRWKFKTFFSNRHLTYTSLWAVNIPSVSDSMAIHRLGKVAWKLQNKVCLAMIHSDVLRLHFGRINRVYK